MTSRFGSTYLSGFQAFAEAPPAGTDLPAGFERGTGAVFVRLSRLPRGAWYVTFVHEMAHALDPVLKRAERAIARAAPVAAALAFGGRTEQVA